MDFDESLSKFFSGEYLLDEQIRVILNYRERCISYALHRNMKMVDVTFGDIFDLALKHSTTNLQLFERQFMGKRVIELGPGADPKSNWLHDKYRISEYVGVEPFYPHLTGEKIEFSGRTIDVIKEDGLSFLIHQPDESAIVISNGVVCTELILSHKNESVDYFRFLAKEIYRVTPKGNPTFHISTFLAQDFFEKVGFELPKEAHVVRGFHYFERPMSN